MGMVFSLQTVVGNAFMWIQKVCIIKNTPRESKGHHVMYVLYVHTFPSCNNSIFSARLETLHTVMKIQFSLQ